MIHLVVRFALVLLVVLLPLPVQAAQKTTKTFNGVRTTVWMPDESWDRLPTVIFSHGANGCSDQSKFLTEGLANAGYLVLAPQHKDAKCGKEEAPKRKRFRDQIQEKAKKPAVAADTPSFSDAENWNDQTYIDRQQDIIKVLDGALNHMTIGPLIDKSKLALAGHSLGGYTALGVAGAWSSWKDPRFKAVLALSPYSICFAKSGNLGGMNIPVMYQGGGRDKGITPSLKRPGGVYDLSSGPKYYVEFEAAGHFSWTNFKFEHHQVIFNYSRAFLDKYLLNMESPILTEKQVGISEFRFQP